LAENCAKGHDETLIEARPVLITVLIDTYNCGHFIEQAVDSVLAQDFPTEQMEILVVDDGSTDDTAERVRKYGDQVQYFCKPNGGQASAFNFGIERARGEIVAFLDGDDYWLPGKLNRVAGEFEQQPEAGMVYHNFFYKRNESPDELSVARLAGSSGFLSNTRESLLSYDFYPTATLAFRRSVLQRLLPVPESLVVQADAHLCACVIFVAPIVYIDQPLTVYRIHEGNLWNWAGNTPPGRRVFEGDPAARARLERQVIASRAIGVGVREWLEKNGFDVDRPDLRAFLMRWAISSRAAEFALSPPGRLQFFRYLLECYWRQFPAMNWKLGLINGWDVVGALAVGYEKFPRWEEGRERLMRRVRGWLSRAGSSFR